MSAKQEPNRKRIFILEDHRVVREGLRLFLEQEPDLEVCGEAEDSASALDAIEKLRPDAVVSDVSLPGTNGIEFIKNLKSRYPALPVIVLSMHDESIYAERALRAGALGYVMKKESTSVLVTAVRKALEGSYYVSEKVTGSIFNKMLAGSETGKQSARSPVDLLSDREIEVFELLGSGKGTREIAQALHLSPKTIESHRAHIKSKLQIESASELTQHATIWVEHAGAVEPP